jgi:PAS domain S-box-containing protein
MKTSHKIIASLVGSVLLAALVVPSFWAFTQIKRAAEERKSTYEVIDRAHALLSELRDAETGQRGYALTGDEAFLEPYLAVRDSVSGHLDQLRQLTSVIAANKHLDAIAPLMNAKLVELSHVIEMRRNHDMTAVLAAVGDGRGKRLMDSIRAEMSSYIQIEEGVLAQRDAEFQSDMRHLFIIIVIVSLFTLLSALLFAYLIYRETQQRLKNLVHVETQHLLEIQEETNRQLQQTNFTLQVSEGKLAVTLNSIGDAVMATDAEGRMTLLNPVAEKLTGWTLLEAAGRPVDEIFHIISQETRQPITIPLKESLAHGTIQGLADHAVLIARDGSECPIADSCAPIRDGDGHVIGAVLVFRNITKEYAAQQALRSSTALIQTILNTVVDGIITLHARGGVVETVNPAAERMFGYTGAELIGQNFSMLIPELDRDRHNGSIEHYIASDEARAIGLGREVVGRRKDGSFFPMEMAISEMWLGDQRYFTGILRDITTRKQAEAEQKQLSQRLRDHQFYTRSLFESNIDAIMTTDPSGIITDVNKQMEVLTDCTRDELIGAPFKNYFTDPDRAEAGIKLVLSEKKVTNYELTARARDGKETVVSYNATTFYDRDRRLQGVFAAARDVTERKRLDQVLKEKNFELESARSEAEKANLAKSEFLSSMSHELRSPLNAILGFAQLMESDSPAPAPAQKESIAQILQAGWHLLKLINDILDLEKVESRHVPLSREPVSMAEVMLECQGMIEPQAQQRGTRMTFPRFDVQYFVLADRTRLKQVLINLLSNAIKYNKPGGAVKVECSEIVPGRIRVNIRDAGAGLSPGQLAQLFQAFNRLGQEAGGEEGTGIGLVVAKRLVELMGGVIGVESTVGVGSVFWFELISVAEPQLPIERGDVATSVQPQVPRGVQLHSLLYIEDNPANLKLVEQIIARHPELHLLTAVNGYSGIEVARVSQPDVILMDINLPDISGFEALKILRADPATALIPAIAISANAMPLDIERGLNAGFFRYITKPIKVNEFMEALDVALESTEKTVVETI